MATLFLQPEGLIPLQHSTECERILCYNGVTRYLIKLHTAVYVHAT